jgi:hypothetical protein
MGIPDVRVRWGILLTVLLIGWTVAPAQAQWMATPYLGVNFAGDVEKRKGGPGGSIGYFADLLGFEFDFQLFKHFFKDADVADLVPNGVDLDTDANTWRNELASVRHANLPALEAVLSDIAGQRPNATYCLRDLT